MPATELGRSTAAILEILIDRALILHEVDRYAPPDPNPDELDRQLEPIRARFSSLDAYRAVLERTGLTERQLRERLRQDLRIRAYLNQRFSVAPASEEELGRFYREHPDQFMNQGQLQAFDQVRSQLGEVVVDARRRTLVEQWTDDLRDRATIVRAFDRQGPP